MEDPKEMSIKFKRLSIIRELKSYAIEKQAYEFASEIRDLERNLHKNNIEDFSKLIKKFIDKVNDLEIRSRLISELREYKLNILNIN
jgi:hypothetical protein